MSRSRRTQRIKTMVDDYFAQRADMRPVPEPMHELIVLLVEERESLEAAAKACGFRLDEATDIIETYGELEGELERQEARNTQLYDENLSLRTRLRKVRTAVEGLDL